MQAVLDLLVDVASAAPSLMSGPKCAVEALLAEDDPELAVLAARLLAAASSAVRPVGGGKITLPLMDALRPVVDRLQGLFRVDLHVGQGLLVSGADLSV